MSREPADAWRSLPPFDRFLDVVEARAIPVLDPGPCPDEIPIHARIEGTCVTVRLNVPGEPKLHVQFRWRKSHKAWQLFAREGSRWVADGAPRASVGRLLEALMHKCLGPNTLVQRFPAGGS